MRSNPNSASNVSLVRRNNAPDTQNILSPFGSATGLFEDLYPLLSVSPFQLMERMQQDMDRLFSQVVGMPRSGYRQNGMQTPPTNLWAPTVDVSETGREYRIEVDLPGVPQDAIDVRVVESTLVIRAELRQESSSEPNSAAREAQQPTNQEQNTQRQYHYRERRWGRFERMFHLPPDADEENIGADFSSGVLTLTVPKKASQSQQLQGRRIAIRSASSLPDENASPENSAGGENVRGSENRELSASGSHS